MNRHLTGVKVGGGVRYARRQSLCSYRSNVAGRTSDHLNVRKQYFFKASQRGLLAWDVDRLVELSAALPRKRVRLDQIRELELGFHGDSELPTWRAFIDHMRLVEEADLSFPIILSANGDVMDGMHRVAKSVLSGRTDIEAVQFDQDPDPDHVGRGPSELTY